MKRFALIALCALATLSCQTPTGDRSLTQNEERVLFAGRGMERAAYTAYARALFATHLNFLESLPRGWFIGTQEMDEGLMRIGALTGITTRFDSRDPDLDILASDIQRWRTWWERNSPTMSEGEAAAARHTLEPLGGTTPLLISVEFQDVIRAVGNMSGIAPSWSGREGEEHYRAWEQFDDDRAAWRAWFDEWEDVLVWDPIEHRFVVGRPLPVSPQN